MLFLISYLYDFVKSLNGLWTHFFISKTKMKLHMQTHTHICTQKDLKYYFIMAEPKCVDIIAEIFLFHHETWEEIMHTNTHTHTQI